MRSAGFSVDAGRDPDGVGRGLPARRREGDRDGSRAAIRLTDDAGRTATIGEAPARSPTGPAGRPGSARRGKSNRRSSTASSRSASSSPMPAVASSGDWPGRVVDPDGRPVEGVRVAPAFHIHERESRWWCLPGRRGTRGDHGTQRPVPPPRDPRVRCLREALDLTLVVRKEGFASLETPEFPFKPGQGDSPQVLDPIRMEPVSR